MWQRIRNWISRTPSRDADHDGESSVEDVRLADLGIVPDDADDFDAESCKQLLDTLIDHGAETVGDVLRLGIRVTLEQFFTGNRCKHSIAANVVPEPTYDTARSWFNHLKAVRDHEQVQDVLVEICMVEPYEDGRLGIWPYADTLWVYSTLDKKTIASLLTPIDPDEVRDASANDSSWDLKPPSDLPAGSIPYWVWWD